MTSAAMVDTRAIPRSARHIIGTLASAGLLLLLLESSVVGSVCPGDCDADGAVTVGELVLGTGIALGTADLSLCTSFDQDSNGAVTVDELLLAVQMALGVCPATPTTVPLITPTSTPTASP